MPEGEAMTESKKPTAPRGATLLALIVVHCTIAAQARADAPPEDTVTLHSGAIYAGQIGEKVPGDHETLKLATGEIKRFAWADIAPAQPPPRDRPTSAQAGRRPRTLSLYHAQLLR
jgi:hypothetical protein